MIQPDDFLRQAQFLIQSDSSDEVALRSAVSRAYYSLYHESLRALIARKRKFLENAIAEAIRWQGRSPEVAKVQALDWDYIVKENNVNLHKLISRLIRDTPGAYALGSEFMNFRLQRDFADYDIEKNPDQSFTKRIIPDILALIGRVKRI